MGNWLPPLEIIRAVDLAGNQDGSASLEDIRPHLDSREKIDLKDSSNFHRALATLNRICRLPANTFHMPDVLRCSVFQDGRLDATRLAQRQNAFIRSQFDKAFRNEHSDDLIRSRYAEFLSFIGKNRVPLPELYGVLANAKGYTVPIEEVLAQNVFYVENQREALFQLSSYAAIWHLKHNVRAFSEDALVRYPAWFQRKVRGFEAAILKKLENWELSPDLGRKGMFQPQYDPLAEKIATPESHPFPPILGDAISMIWHEAFHAYQNKPPLAAQSTWSGERDATLVAAIAFLKMKKITDPPDIPELKRLARSCWLSVTPAKERRDQKAWKENLKDFILTSRYAIHFIKRRENAALQAAFEKLKVEHVLLILFDLAFWNFQKHTSKAKSDHERYLLYQTLQSKLEEKINDIKQGFYEWIEEDGSHTSVTFAEVLRRMNGLLEERSGELDKETFSRLSSIIERGVNVYVYYLTAREWFKSMIKKYEEGKPNWRRVYAFEDLPETLQFLQRYKWIVVSTHADP